MIYDLEMIKEKFKKNLLKLYDKAQIDMAIDKIPEIYSVLLKERQSLIK